MNDSKPRIPNKSQSTDSRNKPSFSAVDTGETNLYILEFKYNKKNMKCPNCKSKNVIKRGRGKGKFGSDQLYYCKDCGRRFADKNYYEFEPKKAEVRYSKNKYSKKQ